MRYVLGVLCLLGCGGGVRYTSTTTKGEGCGDLAVAWCERLIECRLAPTADRSVCISSGQNGCCGTSRTCGDLIGNPTSAAACINAMPTTDCAELGTQGAIKLPSGCQQMF